jgi:hypothetical protein
MIRIISLPRSGSTLLQRLICSNPKIKFVPETWLDLRIFGSFSFKDGKMPYGYNSSVRFSDKFIGDSKNILIEELLKAQDRYLLKKGFINEYFLDKTPNNYMILSTIYRQTDKYILLKRCKKDIFLSYLFEMKFSVLKWWKYVIDIQKFEYHTKCYEDKSNVLVINYEDILDNTEDVLNDLSKFLDLHLTNELLYNSYSIVGDSRAYSSLRVEKRKEGLVRSFIRRLINIGHFNNLGFWLAKAIYKFYTLLKRVDLIIH